MCALDAKLADQDGVERSFGLTISHKQLLGEVRSQRAKRVRADFDWQVLVSAHIRQNVRECSWSKAEGVRAHFA